MLVVVPVDGVAAGAAGAVTTGPVAVVAVVAVTVGPVAVVVLVGGAVVVGGTVVAVLMGGVVVTGLATLVGAGTVVAVLVGGASGEVAVVGVEAGWAGPGSVVVAAGASVELVGAASGSALAGAVVPVAPALWSAAAAAGLARAVPASVVNVSSDETAPIRARRRFGTTSARSPRGPLRRVAHAEMPVGRPPCEPVSWRSAPWSA